MTRTFVLGLVLLAGCSQEQIGLRDMGSFHIGGREVELSGKPVKEVFSPPVACPQQSTSTEST